MSTSRVGRLIGVTAGALAILAVGVYGPATLLGPLPTATTTIVTPASEPAAFPPVLPAAGASAVMAVAPSAQGDAADPSDAASGISPIASAGVSEAVPMASAAKLVTALLVLHAKPLAAGAAGPAVPITAVDYQDYIAYARDDARTVAVFDGETWTERELLQALLLGSSNNHADLLARWAFGSVDAYVAAANTWLAAIGMGGSHVADANGLHDASAGTASDLARLAGIAIASPVIQEILAGSASGLAGRRGVENTTAYLPEEGITGISRSYTDAAGVCFLFAADVDTPDAPFRFAGAILGEPDYDTLQADLKALMASARAGVSALPVLKRGDRYAEFTTPWGETASGVVRISKTQTGWRMPERGTPAVTVAPFSTGRKGATVGRVSVEAAGAAVSAPLVLDEAITGPGLDWRLLNPVPVIAALIDSF